MDSSLVMVAALVVAGQGVEANEAQDSHFKKKYRPQILYNQLIQVSENKARQRAEPIFTPENIKQVYRNIIVCNGIEIDIKLIGHKRLFAALLSDAFYQSNTVAPKNQLSHDEKDLLLYEQSTIFSEFLKDKITRLIAQAETQVERKIERNKNRQVIDDKIESFLSSEHSLEYYIDNFNLE